MQQRYFDGRGAAARRLRRRRTARSPRPSPTRPREVPRARRAARASTAPSRRCGAPIDHANKYIVVTAPFTLAKDPATQAARRRRSCTTCSKRCSSRAVLLRPFLPETTERDPRACSASPADASLPARLAWGTALPGRARHAQRRRCCSRASRPDVETGGDVSAATLRHVADVRADAASTTATDLPPPAGRRQTLIDSHCHLDMDAFDADRDAVLARARGAPASRRWSRSAPADRSQPTTRAVALGGGTTRSLRHGRRAPARSRAWSPTTVLDAARRAGARIRRSSAIGETGLDYYYDNSPRAAAARGVRALHPARRGALGCRSSSICATPTTTRSRSCAAEGARDVGGVIHCFSGDAASARAFLDLGFHISFSGIVTFKTADALREAARIVPADRCWSRPTRRSSPRSRTAAGATSRRWSCRPPRCSRRCAASRSATVAEHTRREHASDCSDC